jgi:hypothetical protein
MLAIEPSALRFCLEAIAVDTPLEGAEVDFQEAGAEAALYIEEIELRDDEESDAREEGPG